MNFQALPQHWSVKRLDDLDTGGVSSVNPCEYPNEKFKYYSIPAYRNGKTPLIEKGGNVLSQKLLIPPRCILFGKLNPRVQKVWQVKQESSLRRIASTEWLPLVPKENIDLGFVYFLLCSDWVMPTAQSLVSGSTPSRQRVNPKAFYEISVPVPPLLEQQKIGLVLGLVDEAIQLQSLKIHSLQKLIRGAIQTLFAHGLRGEAQKETEIGPMPESWELQPLGALCVDTDSVDLRSEGHRIAKFIYYVVQRDRFVQQLGEIETGASYPAVTDRMVKEQLVPLPSQDEQRAIATTLDAIDRKIDLHRRKRAVLEDLFKTLLHKLMTGEIQVGNLAMTAGMP